MRHEASQGQQAKYGRWIGVILIFCYFFKSIVGGQLSESGTRHPTTPLEPTGAVFTGNGITLGLLPLTQLSGPKPRVQYFHFWYDILHTDAVERVSVTILPLEGREQRVTEKGFVWPPLLLPLFFRSSFYGGTKCCSSVGRTLRLV